MAHEGRSSARRRKSSSDGEETYGQSKGGYDTTLGRRLDGLEGRKGGGGRQARADVGQPLQAVAHVKEAGQAEEHAMAGGRAAARGVPEDGQLQAVQVGEQAPGRPEEGCTVL